ncbi:MAG: PfkB family carbohydrate kinase [Elusimicrobiota bacterium]|nr:PfkB family carbohydrate kinase [Elusimicrobiota bacterium]
MRKALIINLNLAIDKTVSLDKIKRGAISRFPLALTYPGGKGVNVARVLNTLGARGDLMGFVSGYNGKWIEASLKKENITFHPIKHKNGESRMCYSIADKSGITTDFNEDGPDVPLSAQSEFFKKLNTIISRYSSLVICGRSPLGIKKGFYKKMAAIAKRKGVKIFFDISGYFLSESLSADLIKINRHEFEDFSGFKFSQVSMVEFFKKNSRHGLKMLIVTNGNQPGYAVCAQGLWRFNSVQINGRIKSTVGSGDSFMAGCVYGDLKKKSFEDVIRISIGCATSDCLSLGAGAIKKSESVKFAKKVLIKKIK